MFLQYEPILPEPAETSEADKLLVIILSSVGSFAVLGLVVSALCYFCYWKKRRKPALKRQEAKESIEGRCSLKKLSVAYDIVFSLFDLFFSAIFD